MREREEAQLPYHMYKGSNTEAPILFIYHGWGGSTAGYDDLAQELQGDGYTVVLPDIIQHDSRDPIANHFDGKSRQQLFWSTVFQTIDEFEHLISDLDVDMEDILVIGSSMGGFIASGIFARYDEIQGLVNVNGSGAFILSEELFRQEDGRAALTEEEKERLKAYDPVEQKYSGAPVLLMHGDRDTIINVKGQHAYAAHCHSSQVVFDIYKDVDHQFTADMVEGMRYWLTEQFEGSTR
ncbi:alpha/beta fold hydrolase [Terribacillus halophilus]|uniref:alpha/beta fold hydrolase n=1 Tax=Terribacillus halophilus TaxID=361279 RepID=UPI0009840E90|nr:alpha/beta fold hydrolase [Terribacillus halophilus]